VGGAIKYIARAPHKGKKLEDLKKAVWYLNHAIALIEDKEKSAGQETMPKPRLVPNADA
jgi:Protein of unknwon function (DUF3310)